MDNVSILNNVFKDCFSIDDEEVKTIKLNEHPRWDSVGHMEFIAELEEYFHLQISTDDFVEIVSYDTCVEVLTRYGVKFVQY